jgi:hypothetical protein
MAAIWGEFGSAMTLTRSRESHGRKAVFLLVLLSHCALTLLIVRSNNSQKSATKILHAPLLVFFIDSTKTKTGEDSAKEPLPVKQQIVSKRRNTESPNPPSGPTEPDATPSNAITDWYGEAHSVAEGVLERDRAKSAKRAFEHKMPPAQAHENDSIFDPLPVPRAGTWDGPDRYYVTDNCYYEWDRSPRPPPTLLDNRLKTPICKTPPRGGGDAMFKDLTPDYLKALPEPKKP